MYYDFFGFREPPFSIAPDPRYLYLSERHKEALAHLMYGVKGQGGFIVITGEVGTGKTTISRCFIESVADDVDIAIVLNPRLSARELLSSICDELGIEHPAGSSIKCLVDLINQDLLQAYAAGRHKVLMIDEAQNLSADVLEQLRLLTNLETAEKKLLQIILLGQPELQDMLARPELRQLNQRVTARYHLAALERDELPSYLRYRMSVAGQRAELFTTGAVKILYKRSGGIPRLINLISDRALLGAYAQGEHIVTAEHIKHAAKEVLGRANKQTRGRSESGWPRASLGYSVVLLLVAAVALLAWAAKDRWRSTPELDVVEAVSMQSGVIVRDATEPVDAVEKDDAAVIDFRLADVARQQPQAFQALFSAWGVTDYNPGVFPVACRYATEVGLACMNRQGTRRSLEAINRPAILTLRNDDGETVYATVLQLTDDVAVVATEQGPVTVSFAKLERYWFGEFLVLWQLPPYMRSDQRVANKGTEELWLSTKLMQLAEQYGGDERERARVKAMAYPDQVRWYQTLKGLDVDGIAGGMTLIQLNSDLNSEVPKLMTGAGQN